MLDISTDLSSLPDEQFRERWRAWLEEHCPVSFRQTLRRPFYRLRGEDMRRWMQLLHDHGWRSPAWPVEHGGLGLSFGKQTIYHEEMERLGVARVVDIGDAQLGPILISHGTAAQRDHYLPRMQSGEHIWCQGYSEPNAGSDLASLRTAAEVVEGGFIVNGQKIWTTQATDATHIFILVRTGNFERKQQGISFLLADINTPGITLRPIVNLAGEDEFCEVFFDNVFVPDDGLVGQIHDGWTVAKALLGYERIWNGSPALAAKALELGTALVTNLGKASDPGVIDRLAALTSDLDDYRLLYGGYCKSLAAGGVPGPECSIFKIYASELLQRVTEFNVEIADEFGMLTGDIEVGDLVTDLHWQNMMSRPPTIFAGTNEVQRDIVAKSVLGLPKA